MRKAVGILAGYRGQSKGNITLNKNKLRKTRNLRRTDEVFKGLDYNVIRIRFNDTDYRFSYLEISFKYTGK